MPIPENSVNKDMEKISKAAEQAKDLTPPKAILFDWDNTLADTWEIIYEALHDTFIHMGHEPWPFGDVKGGREGIHRSLRDSFPKIFGKDWEKAREIYYASFLKHHLDKIKILPGAREVLEELAKTDIYIAVVSNKTGQYLREEVTHLGWDHLFKKIVGATDAAKDKPHKEPVLFALEGSGIDTSHDVWFIGDSVTDIECALNTNCKPVIFGHNIFDTHESRENPFERAHMLHVGDHAELLELIREVIKQ